MSDLHDRIRRRLAETGKPLRRASLDSGLSQEAISKLLKRPDQSQTLSTIRKLSIGLETTPEWLAFGIVSDDAAPRHKEWVAPPINDNVSSTSFLSSPSYRNQLQDSDCIQVEIGELRILAIHVLRRGRPKLSGERAAALADVLIATLAESPGASAVFRLKERDRIAVGFRDQGTVDQA